MGDPLSDNSYEEDGFRYHDINHFTFLEVYGWSPICENKFGIKAPVSSKNTKIEEVLSYLVFTNKEDKLLINQLKSLLDPVYKFDIKIHSRVVEKCRERWNKVTLGKTYLLEIKYTVIL